MLTVLIGGARSGKSTAALRLAEQHGAAVTFIATSPQIDGDADLRARIAAHRAERPPAWATIETELDLAGAIAVTGDTFVVIDCLTLWLGNMMHEGFDDHEITAASTAAVDAVIVRRGGTVVVTNEVGLGIVPGDELSRRYRDHLGRINQQWVAASDRAHLMIAGRALPLTDLGRSPT